MLLIVPGEHQSPDFLFESKNLTGWSFPLVGLYVFGIGLLLAQYTITGFDASAHVSEETHDAHTGPPKAIVRAVYVSAIAALLLNIAMTLAIPTASTTTSSSVGARPRADDLRRVDRRGRRQAPGLHLDRRPDLLRHGLASRPTRG